MLRQEMDVGYFRWIDRPGEHLGVFDNASDYQECKKRVHCNAAHGQLDIRILYDETENRYRLDKSGMRKSIEQLEDMACGRRHTIFHGGEHNNVYFPDFIKYKKTLPEGLMQTVEGNFLELEDVLICAGMGVPMPAIDDPVITGLNMEALRIQAEALKDSQYVAAYQLGFEMLYPEYFGLGRGDFRPASWKHFEQWCRERGIGPIPSREAVSAERITADLLVWYQYREQAMADRCANYYLAVLGADPNHLAFYPTHGSTLSDTRRNQLGQQPSLLGASCDGMEMGHILVQNDRERRNVIMVSHYTSFGTPVIVPRLGNKQPDLSAIGGGRSFSPEMLRRLVYECVGLGISKIFPIHWTSRLHDGEWFIKDTPAEAECRSVFDELIHAAPLLSHMGRLQPQIGLLASDAQWLERWNPRWTGVLQDAYRRQWNITVIADAIISAGLAEKIPVLLLVECRRIFRNTLALLNAYVDAGGRLVILGDFAREDENLQEHDRNLLDHLLDHKRVYAGEVPGEENERILRELFLAGPEYGVDGPEVEYQAVSLPAVEEIIRRHAPDSILKTAFLENRKDELEPIENVNIYCLTDGTALMYVLINNEDRESVFLFKPEPRLLERYRIVDVQYGKASAGTIVLKGHQTKMLFVYPEWIEEAGEQTIKAAEKAFEGWRKRGAEISALRGCYTQIRAGLYDYKRLALAGTILDSLAVSYAYKWNKEGFELSCRIYDSSGATVKGAAVSLRFIPGTFERFIGTEAEEEYRWRISREKMPVYFDVFETRYKKAEQRIRMSLTAQWEEKSGGFVTELEYDVK